MADTTFIIVTGTNTQPGTKFTQFVEFETNHGKVDIEFINRIDCDPSDINYQDFTIVLNSVDSDTNNVMYIDHNNYRRKSLLESIMSKLTHVDVKIIDKKITNKESKEFVFCVSECIIPHEEITYGTLASIGISPNWHLFYVTFIILILLLKY